MKKLLEAFIPSDRWKIPAILILGIFTGLFLYSFYISKAWSYLSDSPKTCLNCHVMTPQYATWFHSSHREVTNCNDCHVPQDNFFRHWSFKAKDGLRHATIFTLHSEPQVIHIKTAGIQVVQANCVRCHNKLFEPQKKIAGEFQHAEERLCWECHRETPHGRVSSLSSVPFARVPLPESPVPDWIKKLLDSSH